MEHITVDVLVVGGGTGGTAAAIQAARRGANTLLVSEFPWLGGMLTAAGVSAPDGNEVLALQTGLWGAFVRSLAARQPGGLDHAWVSFFTYEPRVGAEIFADWVRDCPTLAWRWGAVPREVLRQGERILGVRFNEFTVHATLTLDGTDLGNLLALGDVPHRWGWESRDAWDEPSAPRSLTDPADPLFAVVQRYPVQAPTWVVVMQDFGEGAIAPPIPAPEGVDLSQFEGAWADYGADTFLSYGKLPRDRIMINWPHHGNDYGVGLHRLIGSPANWQAWAKAAIAQSQGFAHVIQTQIGARYGLAIDTFPTGVGSLGGGALALQPYYREGRRLVGLTTITEHDLLPKPGTPAAALPLNAEGEMSAIAIGNYPNDHHYPGFEMPLAPKAMHWGGRWTGTPFAIPYEALIPATVEGLLVTDKNLSVSHIANGATRLQPVVLGLGQAAGMAAALCIERQCQPRELPVRALQEALLNDPIAPAAIAPQFDLIPGSPDWRTTQLTYCDEPDRYPHATVTLDPPTCFGNQYEGCVQSGAEPNTWTLTLEHQGQAIPLNLVTLHPAVHTTLKQLTAGQFLRLWGIPNWAGGWLRVTAIAKVLP